MDKNGFLMSGRFSYGQMYSALASARDFDKLKLIGSPKRRMKLASPVVVESEESTVRRLIRND